MSKSDDPWFWSNGLRMVVAGGVVSVLLTLIVGAFWIGDRATRADRDTRKARMEACATIEDPALRTLCIAK